MTLRTLRTCFLTILPGEERTVLHHLVDLAGDLGADGLVGRVAEDGVDHVHDDGHVGLLQATGGDGGRSDAQTAGLEGAAAVEGHHVLVDGDVGGHEGVLGFLTGELGELGAEVDEHQVVVGTTGDDLVALVDEGFAHHLGVLHHLLDVLVVAVGQSFAEGDGLGGDDVLQRTALGAGEHGAVEQSAHLLDLALRGGLAPRIVEVLTHEDHTAAGSAEGLVGRRGDDVAIFQGIVQVSLGDEAAGMADVAHEDGADLVGDLAHAGPIPVTAVGAAAADDQFRVMLEGLLLHVLVVNHAGLFLHLVANHLVVDAAEVHRAAVREVATVVEVHAHEGVAAVEAGQEHSHVGLCAAVGLHVGPAGAVELLGALDGDGLALVDHLATAIVALAGVAFGVLVGHDGAHGFHHLVADEVLGGNQFDAFGLTLTLFLYEVENLRISLHICLLLYYLHYIYAAKIHFFFYTAEFIFHSQIPCQLCIHLP